MHSPSALTEHVSLNLAGFFLLDPVYLVSRAGENIKSETRRKANIRCRKEDLMYQMAKLHLNEETPKIRPHFTAEICLTISGICGWKYNGRKPWDMTICCSISPLLYALSPERDDRPIMYAILLAVSRRET